MANRTNPFEGMVLDEKVKADGDKNPFAGMTLDVPQKKKTGSVIVGESYAGSGLETPSTSRPNSGQIIALANEYGKVSGRIKELEKPMATPGGGALLPKATTGDKNTLTEIEAKVKNAGFDPQEVFQEFADFPVTENADIPSLLQEKKDNPYSYDRHKAAYKWQVPLKQNILKKDPEQGGYIFQNILSGQAGGSYRDKRAATKQAYSAINEFSDDLDEQQKLKASLATDKAFAYGLDTDDKWDAIRNDERYIGKGGAFNKYQVEALHFLEDTDPEKYQIYNQLTSVKIGEDASADTQRGYESKARELERLGMELEARALQEQKINIEQKINNGTATPQDIYNYKKNEEQWNTLVEDVRAQNQRYPNQAAMELDQTIQEALGQRSGAGKRFVLGVGENVNDLFNFIGDIVQSPFRSKEERTIDDLEDLGEKQFIQGIQRYKTRANELIDPKTGEVNFTSNAILNTISDVGADIVSNIGISATTGGFGNISKLRSASTLFGSTFATTYTDYYTEAIEKNIKNPTTYALVHTTIEAGSELISNDLDVVKKAVKPKSTLGQIVKNITQKEWDEIVGASKGKFSAILEGAKKTGIEGVKTSGSETLEEVTGQGAGNIADATMFNQDVDVTEGMKSTILNTMVGTLPLSIIGMGGNIRSISRGQKYTLYEAAQNSEKYLAQLDADMKAGVVDQAKGEQIRAIIEKSAQSLKELSDSNTINANQTDKEKSDILADTLVGEKAYDENLLKKLKSKAGEFEKGENIQYFIDKAGEAPQQYYDKYGEEITNELLDKVPTEKLEKNLDDLLNINPDNPNVKILDKIISERQAADEKIEKLSEDIVDKTPEEVILAQAKEGKIGAYSEMVVQSPELAKDVLLDYAKQKYGLGDDGSPREGGGREITNKEVDAAVKQSFPNKESVIEAINPKIETTPESKEEVSDLESKKADIERRRKEELSSIGVKQKERAFSQLRDEKDENGEVIKVRTPEEKLNAINLIERNVAEGNVLTKEEQKELQKIKDELASQGYEMPELLGKQYHQGMKVIVTSSIPDESFAEGEEIITKVLTPQINKDGKMVQAAQVEVTVGTKKGGLTREQWLEEQKKKETRTDKINAKYDAELAELEKSTTKSKPKEETTPALKDVESTAKALENIDDNKKKEVYLKYGIEEIPQSTGDGTGRNKSGSLTPLKGSPIVQGATGADQNIVSAAEKYAKQKGITLKRQAEYVEINPEFSKRIADAFEAMPHDPTNPKVKEAYQNLIQQTKDQYEALVADGYKFSFFDSKTDPYEGNPYNAIRDLRNNKKMAVYGTYDGYGTEGITAKELENNPMLADTGIKWKDQNGVERVVTANDLFRAVHDAFGHSMEGAGFRARGEENAWQAHSRLYTGSAIGAMTTETRGQNSWLNFGKYGEHNRNAKVEDPVFAEQKVGLMPEWTWKEYIAPDVKTKDELLSEAYHRAKADGSNPELVKAVEDLLGKPTETVAEINEPIQASKKTEVTETVAKPKPTKEKLTENIGRILRGEEPLALKSDTNPHARVKFEEVGLTKDDNIHTAIDKLIEKGGEFKDIFEAIKQDPYLDKVKLELIDDAKGGENGESGLYHPTKGNLQIWNKGNTKYTAAHEMLHFLTLDSKVAEQSKNTPQYKALEDMYNFIAAKKGKPVAGLATTETYGLTNFKEFMSELMINPDFRNHISDVFAKNREELSKASKNIRDSKATGIGDLIINYIKDLIEKLVGNNKNISFNEREAVVDNAVRLANEIFFGGKDVTAGQKTSGEGATVLGHGSKKAAALALPSPDRTNKIREYIKTALASGASEQDIRDALKENGIKEEELNVFFNKDRVVGITHAQMDEIAKEFGLETYQTDPETIEEWDAEADKRLQDPKTLPALFEKLRKGEAPDKVENRIMIKYMADLMGKIDKNPTSELLTQLKRAKDLFNVAGREWGKAGVARQGGMIASDNLANFLLDRGGDKGKPLSDSQIKAETKKYNELQKAKTEYTQALDKETEGYKKVAAEKGLAKAKLEAKKASKKTHEERVANRKKIVQSIKEKWTKAGKSTGELLAVPVPLPIKKIKQLKAISTDVKLLVQDLVGEGIDKLDVVINEVYAVVKDAVSEITKADIRDIIAGEYDERQQTKAQKNNELRLLQREAGLLKELEDARKGLEKVKNETQKDAKERRIIELEEKIKEVRRLNKERQRKEATDADELPFEFTEEELADISFNEKRQKSLEKRIEKLQDDIKNKRYEPEPKPEVKFKKSQKTQALEDKVIQLEKQLALDRLKDRLAKRTKSEKVYDFVTREILGVKRLLQTIADWSIWLRQTVRLGFNPLKWGIFGKEVAKSWSATWSQKKFDRYMREIRTDPQYQEMLKDGIVFNEFEEHEVDKENEMLYKNWIFKVPILRELPLMSQRAADGALNVARYELYKKYRKNLEQAGVKRESDPEAYEWMSKEVMNQTGRGNLLKMFEKNVYAQKMLGNTFYGARLMASNFNQLNPLYYAKMPKEVRALIWKDIAFYVVTTFATGAALVAAGGKVSFDPDDSDFLQVRFGDKVYDLTGGKAQYIRTALRILEASIATSKTLAGDKPKSETAEKQDMAIESTLRFFRNKLAPNTGYVINLIAPQKEYGGREVGMKELLEFYPMYADDAIKGFQEEGLTAFATILIPNLIGIGYNQYFSDPAQQPVEYLIERNVRSDEMDLSKYKNYKEGGRAITDEERKEFIKKRDEEIKSNIKKLHEGYIPVIENNKVVKKRFSQLNREQIVEETSRIKRDATEKVKEEMFGREKKSRKQRILERKLKKEREKNKTP